MSKLSFVWVKEEGEQDEKSQKIQISSGAYISDLIRILYADQLFERSISSGRSIDCLLTEGKTVSNQYVVNHNFVYEVRFKFNSESVKDDDIEKMKLEIQQFEKRIQRYEKQIQTEREGFQKQIQTEREGFEQQLQRYEKQIQTEREGFEQQLQRFEKQIQTERKGFQKQIQRLKKEVDYLRTDNELLVQVYIEFKFKHLSISYSRPSNNFRPNRVHHNLGVHKHHHLEQRTIHKVHQTKISPNLLKKGNMCLQ
eukprot:TRINITY_DN4271_c0_g1_i2.p1 TRINITY_DN4271_c0_g1~~TRINITY_DN4271_c0_g1_i2.p1  ORF type:complete len:254 (-),score=40.18 TRINITY_DN4271_c0_g1_i2:602-1363(-)